MIVTDFSVDSVKASQSKLHLHNSQLQSMDSDSSFGYHYHPENCFWKGVQCVS